MARQFVVLVGRPGKKPMSYPACEGSKALKTMEVLSSRGNQVSARTSANGVEEDLSLEQMRELFGPDA